MRKRNYFVIYIIVLIFIQLGCEKNNNGLKPQDEIVEQDEIVGFDTIYPKTYLPVFPGSYWIYKNKNGIIDTIFASNDYVLDYYTYSSVGYVSDTFFVPRLNNISIWGYEAHTGPYSHGGSYPFTLILNDTAKVGYNWVIAYWAGNENRRKIIAKDTLILLSTGNEFDSVIIVKEYQSMPYNVPEWWYKRYYAKGIGMIKEEWWSSYNSTYKIKELVDFKINK
jgi:hypothetical protein